MCLSRLNNVLAVFAFLRHVYSGVKIYSDLPEAGICGRDH